MSERGTVVVTGGTGGLGLGVCRVLLEEGYAPVVTWIVPEEREHAEEALGDGAVLRRCDVGDPEAVGGLARELDEGSAPPWGLLHLVGGYHDGDPVPGMDLGAWDRQVELNLRSAAVTLAAFLPGMARRGGGRAVAVSSRAARRPFGGGAAYAASKAGVIALVEAAAEDVKDDGVTVNCVLPSVIDTPANRRAMPDSDHGRWVSPEEVGRTMAFLLSGAASGVRGAAIPVYGRV